MSGSPFFTVWPTVDVDLVDPALEHRADLGERVGDVFGGAEQLEPDRLGLGLDLGRRDAHRPVPWLRERDEAVPRPADPRAGGLGDETGGLMRRLAGDDSQALRDLGRISPGEIGRPPRQASEQERPAGAANSLAPRAATSRSALGGGSSRARFGSAAADDE